MTNTELIIEVNKNWNEKGDSPFVALELTEDYFDYLVEKTANNIGGDIVGIDGSFTEEAFECFVKNEDRLRSEIVRCVKSIGGTIFLTELELIQSFGKAIVESFIDTNDLKSGNVLVYILN